MTSAVEGIDDYLTSGALKGLESLSAIAPADAGFLSFSLSYSRANFFKVLARLSLLNETQKRHTQGGSYLLYSLDYGNTSIKVKAQLNFEQTYTYRRMFINHQLLIHVQALISFPYTFYNRRAALDGIDVVLFSHLFYYLRWDWQEVKVTGASAKEMLYVSIDRLLSGTVDLMITRRIADAPFLPTIAVPELIRFCLVVPRKSSMEFFNNLFQPFSTDLWTLIGCVSFLLYGVKLLGEGDTKVGTLLRTLTHASPLHRFVQIALSFGEFILIECYLARVTSLLLVHRFQPEPETLAQFFATDIPMHMLSSHLAFVHQLAPDVTAAILARAVLVDGLDRTSHTHAYLDAVDRASYTIAVLQSTDPTSGRKASYILPETVSSFPAAYMVARTAAPLRDCLALHLDWMRAFGFRRLMDRLFDNLLEADVRRVVITEDLVQIEHMPYEWAEPVPLKTSLQRAREVFATLLNLLAFAFESVPLWWETLVAQFVTPSSKNISGQTALVTGGANGLGQSIAIALAKEGCNVAVVDVDETNARETVANLRRYNVSAEAYKVDVSDYEAVRQLGRDVERDLGPVDILVNNAGILPTSFSQDALPSHIERSMGVNVLSSVWTTQTFIDSMIRRRKGHIVAISSIAGYIAPGWAKTYATTKFALRGFMDALEDDLYLRGQANHVHTTTVFPFAFNTRKQAISLLKASSGLTRLPIYEPAMLGETVVRAIKTNQRKVVVPEVLKPYQLSIYENLPIKIRQLLTRTMAQGEVKLVD
uniref:Short-chain dehydrogenase/reductase 3 n=1 Tax=Anopheles coluzzii TaxID=1518534 RepID=A0A8W7PUI5_ANOCL